MHSVTLDQRSVVIGRLRVQRGPDGSQRQYRPCFLQSRLVGLSAHRRHGGELLGRRRGHPALSTLGHGTRARALTVVPDVNPRPRRGRAERRGPRPKPNAHPGARTPGKGPTRLVWRTRDGPAPGGWGKAGPCRSDQACSPT
jgi:hypothetical protein